MTDVRKEASTAFNNLNKLRDELISMAKKKDNVTSFKHHNKDPLADELLKVLDVLNRNAPAMRPIFTTIDSLEKTSTKYCAENSK